MENLTVSSIYKIQRLQNIMLDLQSNTAREIKITYFSIGFLGIMVCIQMILHNSYLSWGIFIGALFLLFLIMQLHNAEKSLSEYYSLISTIIIHDHDIEVNTNELRGIVQYLHISKRFVLIYYSTKILNWISFMIMSGLVLFEIFHLAALLA